MIVVDTGGLYAALDERETLHASCAAALLAAKPPRLLSPFVLAELDYLIGTRVGHKAQLALLDDVARGAYRLEPFGAQDVAQAKELMAKHGDQRIGLADASVVVLATRHRARDILTTDLRHFRAFRGAGGRPFRLLPADTTE